LTYYPLQEEEEEQLQEKVDPYTLFVYGIRSPYTKESYFRRLRGFFDAINLDKDTTFRERCNTFVHRGRKEYKVRRSQQARCITTSRRSKCSVK
jgi:hypothetical protein